MKIEKQITSTNWSWDKIKVGDILIMSEKYTDRK